MLRVMARLNLTLDDDTWERLGRHADRTGQQRASAARLLLREALARRESLERRKQMARDYAEGRPDAVALLRDLEGAQIDVLEDE